MRHPKLICLFVISSFLIVSCAGGKKEQTGSVLGAVAGAVIGYQTGGNQNERIRNAFIGAVAGAVAGNIIGRMLDERDQKLNDLAKQSGAHIQTARLEIPKTKATSGSRINKPTSQIGKSESQSDNPDQTVYVAAIQVDQQFESNSSQLTSYGRTIWAKTAQAFKSQDKRYVLIVGHTDNTGLAEFNQRLSEERARAVGRVFVSQGFSPDSIYYKGAGYSQPIGNNLTVAGRAKNRRVEVSDASDKEQLGIYSRLASAQPTPSVAPMPKVTKALRSECILPFSGVPVSNSTPLLAYGKETTKPSGMWDAAMSKIGRIIPQAHASDASPIIPLFMNDKSSSSGDVKRIDGGTADLYKPSDYMPGYYQQPVYSQIGRSLFYLKPISLLTDGYPVTNPEMGVYMVYQQKGSKLSRLLKGKVKTYHSGKKILMRWKADQKSVKQSGILGMDVLLPMFGQSDFEKVHTVTLKATAYYYHHDRPFAADISANIKLSKITDMKWELF